MHLTQAERQVCDLVRALALPLPGFSQLREECVVRGEISLFDDLASVLRGLQLAHPHRDQVARACEKFGVRRVGTARFLGLFRKECQMGREESIEELLLIRRSGSTGHWSCGPLAGCCDPLIAAHDRNEVRC